MSAAVSALTTVAIVNASHGSSAALGPAIFQLVGIGAALLYFMVVLPAIDRKKERERRKAVEEAYNKYLRESGRVIGNEILTPEQIAEARRVIRERQLAEEAKEFLEWERLSAARRERSLKHEHDSPGD